MKRVKMYTGAIGYVEDNLHYVKDKDVVHKERDTYTITNKVNANKVEKWIKRTLVKVLGRFANVTPYERHERISVLDTVTIDLSNLEEEIATQVHRIKEQGGEVDFVIVGAEESSRLELNNRVIEYGDEVEYQTMKIHFDRGETKEEYCRYVYGINIRVIPWITGVVAIPKSR